MRSEYFPKSTVLLALFVCVSAAACAPRPPKTRPAAPVARKAAVSIADREAARRLSAFNRTPQARRLGGPFLLRDYERFVSAETDNGHSIIVVMYKYRRPVQFMGHPQHFSVWVYRASGATRFFSGR